MPACRLSAGWALPVEGSPIAQAAVLIDPDGRIARVGPEAEVPAPPDVPASRHPDAVLVPGLVNVHTHLELTGLGGEVDDAEFAEWIRHLRERKAARAPDAWAEAARRGVADCWAGGVTTVADTGDSGAVIRALAELGGTGIAYQEVFGPHPEQCATSLAALVESVTRSSRFASERVRIGVSPHAPYTVSGPLYSGTAAWARGAGLPIAVHLAESPAETQLLRGAAGPFAEAWRRRGIPAPAQPGCSPVAWLERHGVLGPDTLAIHVVQVDADDIARLARAGSAVAHCPRSNRRHGHGAAPLGRLLAAGLRVGLGTDSEVSVGALDLLAEARAARELAGLSADGALELATLGGARALGLEGEIGSLLPGKWGDIAAVRVEPGTADSLAERVLESRRDHVVATYVGGRQVYRRPEA
ncbi:MAG TPA: amidohydrolase family protein [Gemmatimonadales bacterium]|nr:amidohydrolase family protein [Gemmatimonadales bacterium]